MAARSLRAVRTDPCLRVPAHHAAIRSTLATRLRAEIIATAIKKLAEAEAAATRKFVRVPYRSARRYSFPASCRSFVWLPCARPPLLRV